METQKNDFSGEFPAIVELFGHSRMAGMVSEFQFGGASFIRINVPEIEQRKSFTRLVNPSAVYALNPVDQDTMMAIAKAIKFLPIDAWEIGGIIQEMQEKIKTKKLEAENNHDDDDE